MLMDEQLKNNPHEAFSSKWIKDSLMEQLRNDIVKFYDQQKSSGIEEE